MGVLNGKVLSAAPTPNADGYAYTPILPPYFLVRQAGGQLRLLVASGLRLRSNELNAMYGVSATCIAYVGFNLTRVTLWHYSCVHSCLVLWIYRRFRYGDLEKPISSSCSLGKRPRKGSWIAVPLMRLYPSIELTRPPRARYPNREVKKPRSQESSAYSPLPCYHIVLGMTLTFFLRRPNGVPSGTRGRFNFEQKQR